MGALYGPLHGGANEAVLRMLQRIGSVEHVPAFVQVGRGGWGRERALRSPSTVNMRPCAAMAA